MPDNSGNVRITGLDITYDGRRPVPYLLHDLGDLQLTISYTTILRIPVALAYTATHTVAPDQVRIDLDLRSFLDHLPMSAIRWQMACVTLHVKSWSAIQAVAFALQTEASASASPPTVTVQQLLTQTRQNPAGPLTQWLFPVCLTLPTRGIFVDAAAEDIVCVRLLDTECERDLGAPTTMNDEYVFVGMETHDGYTREGETVYVEVTFRTPRSAATIHCAYTNDLCFRGGMLEPFSRLKSGDSTGPRMWPVTTKALAPTYAECPIGYEPIRGAYYECDLCHYAFDAQTFCRYAAKQQVETMTCPMCRCAWTNRMRYIQL